jgi:maltose O-acetyltransferase
VGEQKDRMLRGQWYQADEAELVAERQSCQARLGRFNAAGTTERERDQVLRELLGGVGPGSAIMPRLACDYGYLIRLGANCFVNYDPVFLDCAPITIGDDVGVGPRAQLLTPIHPMAEHDMRRARWEAAAPITIGDNAWLGGGVIVSGGASIGANTVVGAGSVVTRDLPSGVFAAGNPARVIREL